MGLDHGKGRGNTLELAFKSFCLHGAGQHTVAWEIDGVRWAKWCRESGVVGLQAGSPHLVDVAFSKSLAQRKRRRVDYVTLRGLLIPTLAKDMRVSTAVIERQLCTATPQNNPSELTPPPRPFRTHDQRREVLRLRSLTPPLSGLGSQPLYSSSLPPQPYREEAVPDGRGVRPERRHVLPVARLAQRTDLDLTPTPVSPATRLPAYPPVEWRAPRSAHRSVSEMSQMPSYSGSSGQWSFDSRRPPPGSAPRTLAQMPEGVPYVSMEPAVTPELPKAFVESNEFELMHEAHQYRTQLAAWE
eukprot:TRINITY_DN43447_c0_g1_i1.p1 TRINITY_DN43447_c0_g1~~TRINITY_DN43447_c0_g1_i1.p1  ORF type:complete len:312 (+),score=12.58 TRINITY_DN43447_c0_g1_i1:39-938(+)